MAEEAAHALAEAAKWNPEASRRNRLAANTRRELLARPRQTLRQSSSIGSMCDRFNEQEMLSWTTIILMTIISEAPKPRGKYAVVNKQLLTQKTI